MELLQRLAERQEEVGGASAQRVVEVETLLLWWVDVSCSAITCKNVKVSKQKDDYL